ncbi:MAG: hypothetical protein RL693_136 [Verrucomicrobiota bacterium]|jgi:hypothetical protein
MTTQLEMHPDSINQRLAKYLHEKKEIIISEWLQRVQVDTRIVSTETLNTIALKNHLPQIFDDLTDTLRRYGSKIVADQAIDDAEDHGATRFRQGYELPEMLRELKHFRAIIIYHLQVFDDLNENDGLAAKLFVSTTIHGFIDELCIDATEEYLWSKMSLQDQIHQGSSQW